MKVIGSANNIFGSYNILFLLKFNFAAVEDELRHDGDIRIISTYYYKMDNISIYPKNIRKVFDQYFENLKIKDINTNNKGHFITIIGGKE